MQDKCTILMIVNDLSDHTDDTVLKTVLNDH